MATTKGDNEKRWKPTPKQAAFISALTITGNVTRAAQSAGYDRASAYQRRESNPAFALAWDEAMELAVSALEIEARRRAAVGIDEPVYYKGQVVGTTRKYSDTLLIFLLKAHRPEMYRDNFSIEHTGKGGKPIEVAHTVDVAALLTNPVARKALEQLSEAAGYDDPA